MLPSGPPAKSVYSSPVEFPLRTRASGALTPHPQPCSVSHWPQAHAAETSSALVLSNRISSPLQIADSVTLHAAFQALWCGLQRLGKWGKGRLVFQGEGDGEVVPVAVPQPAEQKPS